MSGFTTFNAAGFGAGAQGNVLFSYDPFYTSSVPTQNIPGGTTAITYIPGSYEFSDSNSLQVTNPQTAWTLYNYPFSEDKGKKITDLNGSGDFTVECWWYPSDALGFTGLITASQNNANNANCWALVYLASGDSGVVGWWYNGAYLMQTPLNTVKVNTWNHIAYVRSSGTGRLFVNGVLATSAADANTYRTDLTSLIMNNFPAGGAGNMGTGTFSQPRITLSAVYPGATSFIPNPVLGVLADTTFYAPAPSSATATSDFSPSGQTISAFTGSVTYVAFSPAGSAGAGAFLPDASSYIRTANTAKFNFGTGNFTVEYWVNTPYTSSSVGNWLVLGGTGNVLTDGVSLGGGVGFQVYNVSTAAIVTSTSSFVVSPNSWNHFAWGKSGSNMTIWINGQQVASSAFSGNVIGNNITFNPQSPYAPIANLVLGPMRISNSAVYPTGSNFSPSFNFTNTANTVFLLQPSANLSTYLTDQSTNPVTVSAFGNVVSSINRVDYNISGNVIGDISGSNNTGLILKRSGAGNVIPATFQNNRGGYWQFSGATGNAYIQSTSPVSTLSNTSISTWIQTSSASGMITSLENAIAPRSATADSFRGLYIRSTGNVVMYANNTASFGELTATGNIVDNRWHHIVNTYNPTTRSSVIYIDGVIAGNTTFTGTTAAGNGWYKVGGSFFINNVPGLTGNIGPTAVYQSVLTAEQVAQIYSSQLPRFSIPSTGNAVTGTVTLSSIGTVQTFVVPTGVTSLRVTAVGGAGSGSTDGAADQTGGSGANIIANVAVTPGQTLYAVVGLGGRLANTSTQPLAFGGGGGGGLLGSAGAAGGQGGGFTGLFTSNPTTQPSNLQAAGTAILIAGGGGGAVGAGSSTFGKGGNAAISLTGNATSGNSFATGFTAVGIVSASSTGTSIVVTMTALGNVSTTNFSIGSPVGFSGIGNVTASNVYYVSAANNSSITAIAAPGSFGIPSAGNLTVSTARVWAGNTSVPSTLYGGGGGAWWSFGNAYPGWQGLIGGDQDSRGTIYPATSQISPTPGNVLQGGVGSFGNTFYGGGGGGGGYYGGGGGVSGTSGGGGGINYANLQVVGNVTVGTLNVGSTGNGANGTLTIAWSSQNSANYTYQQLGNVSLNNGVDNAPQVFTVPQGVSQIQARVVGATGGRAYSTGLGGGGANIVANIAVTPGQNLYMIVGQGGITGVFASDASGGAANNAAANNMTFFQGGGGGAGKFVNTSTNWGGQGGGFSGIFSQYPSNAAVGATSAILIAGGGGGGSGGAQNPSGGNAASTVTGNSIAGTSGISDIYFFNNGWSSTGTQIVANIASFIGTPITIASPPGNLFATGMALQLSVVGGTAVGNVTAGQYVTVASAVGNSLFLNNGNIISFPANGATGGNTAVYTFNYANAWNSALPGTGGGPASLTSGGFGGLQSYNLNGTLGTYTLATSGAAFAGGTGGSSNTDGFSAAGGGGGGGWYGGGGGSAGRFDAASGGGGSNYANTQVVGNITYGTITPTSGNDRINGNIFLQWANSASYTYNDGTVQTFTVPNYVTRLNVNVVGAAGAASNAAVGGAGANISATLTVTPGQTLFLVAGQGGRVTSSLTGNIATGNIAQGGGGGSYGRSGTNNGGTGGGFSGIFTQNPVDVSTAQSSAVLVAGGGGAASWPTIANALAFGGNASTTISANASHGSANTAFATTSFLQAVTNVVVTSSTAATINLNTSVTNKINYTVGTPISVGGGSFSATPFYITAVSNTQVTITTGPLSLPAVGTYTGTTAYPGGYNGTGVAAYNIAGGGATPSAGGYQSTTYDLGTEAGQLTPTGGSALAGGTGGYCFPAFAFSQGAGGGGGWYGGGGAASGGSLAAGAGGGSNYANTLMVSNISYGTLTTTAANATAANGRITITW
jgi:hypothetical protein